MAIITYCIGHQNGGHPCSSKMEVKREGQAYTIEDRDGDVVYRPKVKNIVHVSSLLGMVEMEGEVERVGRGMELCLF